MCILCYELYYVFFMGYKENNSKYILKIFRFKFSDLFMKFIDMKFYIIMKIFLVYFIIIVFCYIGYYII